MKTRSAPDLPVPPAPVTPPPRAAGLLRLGRTVAVPVDTRAVLVSVALLVLLAVAAVATLTLGQARYPAAGSAVGAVR